MFQRKSLIDQEWDRNQKKERKFLSLGEQKEASFLNQMLAEKVPDKMQGTLEKAFAKAFGVIFEQGTGIIEKTYKKDELQKEFKINEYANEIHQSKKSLKVFEKKAGSSGRMNLVLSGATGIGMGILGIGIPDIPLFTVMVLRSIYEIALSYGFEYESEAERRFILMLIQGAVFYGSEMLEVNDQIDMYINTGTVPCGYAEKVQIKRTAAGLSKELLYMKFLQGIPIIGAVGGFYDAIYMKRITKYANLKYKKRFLMNKK